MFILNIVRLLSSQILVNGPSKLSQLSDKTLSASGAGAGAASGAAGYKSPQAQVNQGFSTGYAAESSYSAPTQYNQAYPTQGQGQYGQQGGAMYSQAPQAGQAPHVSTEMSHEHTFCILQAAPVLYLSLPPSLPPSLPSFLHFTLPPFLPPLHPSMLTIFYPYAVWSTFRIPAIHGTIIRSVLTLAAPIPPLPPLHLTTLQVSSLRHRHTVIQV